MINWILALLFISLTPSSSGVALYQQCGGEGYKGSTQCDWPLGCFRRSRWFSSCQTKCPGGDWECTTTGGTSSSVGLAKAWEQCGGEGWNGPRGCSQYPCQWRTKWYAQCRPDCPADWLCQGSVTASTATSASSTAGSTDPRTVTPSIPLESSSSTDGGINVTSASAVDSSSEAVLARYVISLMLGSNAFDLDVSSFETSEAPDLYSTVVTQLITIAEAAEPGLMEKFGAALQAESLDERLEVWSTMSELIQKLLEGSDLVSALIPSLPLTDQMPSASFLRSRGANTRASTPDQDACQGPTPDVGKVNGFYGSRETDESGTTTTISTATLLRDYQSNSVILAEVELGFGEAPDPESRLGAFYATRGYGPDTVGRAVHRAIGAIYLIFGTAGEEKIGRVFNSEAAKALYKDSVKSSSNECIAAIEYLYWANVEKEHPWSFGGNLGKFFEPRSRNCIQQLLSGNRCSSKNRRSLSVGALKSLTGQQRAGEALIIPSGYSKSNYRCMGKAVYCNSKAKSALACIVEDIDSHKGGVWKAGPLKTWGEKGCPTNLRSGTYDANLNWIAA